MDVANQLNQVGGAFLRFGIATVACGLCYLVLMLCVLKIEGGSLYVSSQVPWGAPDKAHRRARRTLLLGTLLFATLIAIAGYLMHAGLTPEAWLNFGRPAMAGGLFSMLYTIGTRYHSVRPRAD
jgi:hypothetical protein